MSGAVSAAHDRRRTARRPKATDNILETHGRHEAVRRPDRRQRRVVRDPAAVDRVDHRAERRGEDDVLQHPHRAVQADDGHDRVRRQRRHRRPAGQDHGARHGADVPEHPPLRHDDRGRERHGRPARADEGRACSARSSARRACARRRSAVREKAGETLAYVGLPRSGSTTSSRSTSPTATSAAWRSPARWRPTRRCCCSTSRPPA